MGWKVVKEYDTNPLADDSEDERRLYRAESRANRKAKAEKVKKTRRRFNPYIRPAATTVTSTEGYGTGSKKPGLCFLCHKPGHWKNECELAKGINSTNNKLSSNCFVLNDLSMTEKEDNACEAQTFVKNDFLNDETYQPCIEAISEKAVESPVGRLRQAREKWRQAGANEYILRVITEGYSIPFREFPGDKCMKNNKSARDNMNFVRKEISKLLHKGCVTECSEKPKVINPLTVAFGKNGKERLVLDCRYINQFLVQYKFKYEDVKVALQMFEKGSYLFSYDLKSAYHHLLIKEEMRTYLGFSVEQSEVGEVKYYVFNVLAFGLATAGYIFTKVMKVLVAYWRSQGHKVIMFLDDGIGGHLDFDRALQLSTYIQRSLTEFGFLLAVEKCHWAPVLRMTWLGFVLDMAVGKVFVTEERIQKLEAAIESFLFQLKVSAGKLMRVKFVASVVGQIISLQTVMGKIVSLRTRALYGCILSRASWEAPVFITQEAIDELHFWKDNASIMNRNGRDIAENMENQIEVYCDASSVGYGGYYVASAADTPLTNMKCMSVSSDKTIVDGRASLQGGMALYTECIGKSIVAKDATCVGYTACSEAKTDFTVKYTGPGVTIEENEVIGSWSEAEASKSSTWREAETVKRVLVNNLDSFEGKKLKVFSDNKNVKSILSSGSRKKELQEIAMNVYDLCKERGITLIPEWIPRDENQRADYLSRCVDCDDWEVTDFNFQYLDKRWGPHTVDRFSSNYNNKLVRFNSRWWVPGTEAVNAFDQQWSGECNWMVPPPRLISLCLNKLQAERAVGTLVIPEWESAPFWAKLFDENGQFLNFLTDVIPLQNPVKKGKGNNGIFGKDLKFRMLALKIRFK